MISYELVSSGFIVGVPSAGSAKHGDDSPSAYVWSYEHVDFLHGQEHQVVVFVVGPSTFFPMARARQRKESVQLLDGTHKILLGKV
jgi:hypothetical protein